MGTRHKNVRSRICRHCHQTSLLALLTFSSLSHQTQVGLIILDASIEPLRTKWLYPDQGRVTTAGREIRGRAKNLFFPTPTPTPHNSPL
jgi:hypothetical protein